MADPKELLLGIRPPVRIVEALAQKVNDGIVVAIETASPVTINGLQLEVAASFFANKRELYKTPCISRLYPQVSLGRSFHYLFIQNPKDGYDTFEIHCRLQIPDSMITLHEVVARII